MTSKVLLYTTIHGTIGDLRTMHNIFYPKVYFPLGDTHIYFSWTIYKYTVNIQMISQYYNFFNIYGLSIYIMVYIYCNLTSISKFKMWFCAEQKYPCVLHAINRFWCILPFMEYYKVIMILITVFNSWCQVIRISIAIINMECGIS